MKSEADWLHNRAARSIVLRASELTPILKSHVSSVIYRSAVGWPFALNGSTVFPSESISKPPVQTGSLTLQHITSEPGNRIAIIVLPTKNEKEVSGSEIRAPNPMLLPSTVNFHQALEALPGSHHDERTHKSNS